MVGPDKSIGITLPEGMAEMAVPLGGTPDQYPRPEELTFTDLLGLAFTKAETYLSDSTLPHAKREYALAKTAIEDSVMRFNRARTMDLGVFNVTDTEDPQFLHMIETVLQQQEGGGEENGNQ
jgi:hypothetical protein